MKMCVTGPSLKCPAIEKLYFVFSLVDPAELRSSCTAAADKAVAWAGGEKEG